MITRYVCRINSPHCNKFNESVSRGIQIKYLLVKWCVRKKYVCTKLRVELVMLTRNDKKKKVCEEFDLNSWNCNTPVAKKITLFTGEALVTKTVTLFTTASLSRQCRL